MQLKSISFFGLLTVLTTEAYPWAAESTSSTIPWRDNEQIAEPLDKRRTSCPSHVSRQGAAPYSEYYPSKYTGAKNGQAGTGKGGVVVPAKGDTAHAYVAPGPTDIRGPCPGLNTLANHNFISHDGLTTYTEMVDAAQNVFNWKHDLASFVAAFGVIQDGNILTETLSIGCRPGLMESNTGLNTHNKFEADVSLSRTDFALSPSGDGYSVNGSLFGDFVNTCGGRNFIEDCMGAYVQKRFMQSLHTNGNLFNGPLIFFVIGTATLPISSFANFITGSPVASIKTISSFWGAKQKSNGSWYYSQDEHIPSNWYNRPTAFSLGTVTQQVFDLYKKYPEPLGGNTGAPDSFVGLNYPGFIQNGTLENATPQGIACLLYQTATIGLPTSLTQTLDLATAKSAWAKTKLNKLFEGFGCSE